MPAERSAPAANGQESVTHTRPPDACISVTNNAVLVLGNVNFDYDKFDLTSTARSILAEHASALRNRPEVNIRIAGHCDERGTIEYNLALGEKRANSVRDYLVSLGVERSRLSTISYGKERPLDARSNEQAWAQNRRAEFVILNQ